MSFYFQPNFTRFLPERVFHLRPAVYLVKLLSSLKQTGLQIRIVVCSRNF